MTNLTIGDSITTREQFNALPLGTVLTDQDGWIHTKVADGADLNSEEAVTTTTYFDNGGDEGTFYACWNHGTSITSFPDLEVAAETEVVEVPARPVIDWSGDRRATHRGYAKALVSKVNKDLTNKILKQVAAGEAVDAYALAEVLPDVFSGTVSRKGNSLARRDQASTVRALAYIVNATIRNHADGLPVFEPGERSPALKAAKAEVAALEETNLALNARLDEVKYGITAANDEVTNLAATVEAQGLALAAAQERNEAVLADFDRLNALYATAQDNIGGYIRKIGILQDTLDYTRTELLSGETRAQSFGFEDGATTR